jgi:hypothetical protein
MWLSYTSTAVHRCTSNCFPQLIQRSSASDQWLHKPQVLGWRGLLTTLVALRQPRVLSHGDPRFLVAILYISTSNQALLRRCVVCGKELWVYRLSLALNAKSLGQPDGTCIVQNNSCEEQGRGGYAGNLWQQLHVAPGCLVLQALQQPAWHAHEQAGTSDGSSTVTLAICGPAAPSRSLPSMSRVRIV